MKYPETYPDASGTGLDVPTRSIFLNKAGEYAIQLETILDGIHNGDETLVRHDEVAYLFCSRELAERSARTGTIPPSDGWAFDRLAYELGSEFGRAYPSTNTTVSIKAFEHGFARAVADCRRYYR